MTNNGDGAAGATASLRVTCTDGTSVTLSNPTAGSLTAGQVSTAYSQNFSASGGTGVYTYSVTSGTLPAGLSLASNGALTGTPTTAGTANFTITATDGNSVTGQAAYSLQINAAAASTVATLSSLTLSQGTLTPTFASGTTSYTASVANGVTSLTVTPTVTQANATLTVNSVSVASGAASGNINLNVGTNTITVAVTAQDGTTVVTYTVTVTRAAAAPSSDATLSGLTLSQGTLTPTFASGTTSYTASVANGVTSLTVTPTVTQANATLTVNSVSVASGAASGSINLNVGTNTITVAVTAQDGTTVVIYTVTVTRAAAAPSSDATLSGLTLSQGTLTPTFASGTTSYTASVANSVTSLTVTPTVTQANATLTVNSVSVASGAASGSINLNVGTNTITVAVTAQDGTTVVTYTVTVTRAAAALSSDATLSSLTLSQGTLTPTFASGTTSYTASVANGVTSLTVTPTVTQANATLTVNSVSVASGAASGSINLNVGTNTIIVAVTAQDGTTVVTYTVTVTRAAAAPSSDATLSGLTLSQGTLTPTFASGTTSYTASVANGVTSLTVTPTVTQANATLTVNSVSVASGAASGSINLNVGTNTITVAVTAQDGTTVVIYTVTVTRAAAAPSSDATLSGLTLSQGTLTPTFASGTTSYTASVANSVTSLTVTPTVTQANATLTVNSVSVASGAASGSINLNVGTNTITVAVTAQDGTTVVTYTVTVTRAAAALSSDATLSSLTLSQGTLTPTFASGTTSYTASVANGVTSLTVTPTVTQANATLTVNSVSVASGAASGSINLNVGTNTIIVAVTAQDGTTVVTYTVTVTRAAAAPSSDATLSGLTLSQGTLTPTFASGTTSYTASVANGVTSMTVTPTVTQANATLTVNSVSVASGAASGNINLNVGTNTITVAVTAQDGTTVVTYTVTVTRGTPVNLSPASGALAEGRVGAAYSQSFSATGGRGPYTYAVSGGLPAGLSLSGTGALTGTPTSAGPATFTVTATDADGLTVSAAYSLQINGLVTLVPAAGALAEGRAGVAYSQTFATSGGKGPYTYSVTGALPAGLSLSSGGVLSGTPTVASTVSFTINVTDADGITSSVNYSLVITAATVTIRLSPQSGNLPNGMAGEQFAQAISATGGVGAVTYSLASGVFPKGMTLNLSTGELTGPFTADSEGDYTFSIQARDSNGNTVSAAYALKVTPRAVTVADKQQDVPAGSTPVDVPLHRGATGGPFVTAERTFVEPASAGIAIITQGAFTQASPAAPVGWYLQFTPNPSYSGQVRVGFRLTSALGVSNTGTVTYNIGLDKTKVTSVVDGLVRDFVRSRQSLIASVIKVPDLLKRRRMQATTEPVTTRMTPSQQGVTLGFSTSLAQLEAARNGSGGANAGYASPFNIWIDGSFMAHNREKNGDRWGSFAMISAGADYLLNDKVLLGLSFHYDRMSDPTDEDATLTGNGWFAGPYASVEMVKGVFWNANLLYGGSANDIDTAFWDGGFDTRRWLVDSSLNGQLRLNEDTLLVPKLRAVYLSEAVKDYTVSNEAGDNLDLKGFSTEQLRISFGAELTREFTLENGVVLTPRLGVTGGYSGLDGSGAFGQLAAGVSLDTEAAWVLDFDLLFNFEQDGQMSTGARARIGGRF